MKRWLRILSIVLFLLVICASSGLAEPVDIRLRISDIDKPHEMTIRAEDLTISAVRSKVVDALKEILAEIEKRTAKPSMEK
jgi:ABC-type molybdate transport system substrate-binding protein